MKTIFVVFAMLVCVQVVKAQQYQLTILVSGPGNGSGGPTTANGINSNGQVVGTYTNATNSRAFLYSGGYVTYLGTFPGNYGPSYGYGINSSGQVVGQANHLSGANHGFLYTNGVMQDLNINFAYAVNDSGVAVGYANVIGGSDHAFLYSSSTGLQDLGSLFAGGNSEARAVNNSGQIVGDATTNTNARYNHAILWQNSTMLDLGVLGGDGNSIASRINDSGQVVGSSITSSGATHAFLYSGGSMQDLGTIAGDSSSDALGINNSGQVVGYGDSGAFLYSNGSMQDLNNLVSPKLDWTLLEANAINDSGQIVGEGIDGHGDYGAFLLTPSVPEPTSTSFLLFSLLTLKRRLR